MVLERVDDLVGDDIQRLIPAGAPPLAFAALTDPDQRVLDPVRTVHVVVAALALVAAARVVLGDIREGQDVFRLLFAHDHAILRVDEVGACAGAVDEMGAAGFFIPGPLRPMEVLPTGIFELAAEIHGGCQCLEAERAANERCPSGGEKASASHLSHYYLHIVCLTGYRSPY